jgi:outer membrane receptor protein involved in Fe transport
MLRKKQLTTAVSAALGLGTSALILPGSVLAQEQIVEEVLVTGSRIVRKDFVAPSPVQTVDSERITLQGTINTEQLLNQLPQVVPGLTNTSNNPGDGTASVDLRGLGSQRTLVLVNGKRMVPTGQDGTVDINNIPAALIERVEVVTGGASAVYGSDAVAGVVNFIMKTDFEGVQFDSRYSLTEENDGDRYDLSLTMGANFDGGRGNATFFVGYTDREDVFAGDRGFSETALGDAIGDDPYLYPFGSSGIPGTLVFGTANFPDGTTNSSGARFNPDGTASPYNGATDSYNFSPVNYLQLPQERYTMNANIRYDLNDKITAYGEGLFVETTVPQQLAPTPAQLLGVNFAYADSPFLSDQAKQMFAASFDEDGDGVAEISRLRRRLVENDVRFANNDRTVTRFIVGLKGDLGDSWQWDVYYNWGKVKTNERLTGDAAGSRLTAALNTVDGVTCIDPLTGGAIGGGCVPANIWGEGNISPEAIDYIQVGATNTTDYEQVYFGGTMTGTVFELPAGDVGVAFGAEYRDEKSAFTPDEFLASGDVLGFNSGEPTVGEFDVTEVFGEINVPILADVPFASYLGVNGAYRYSDYSTVGTVSSFAYGAEWAPISDLRFRGQFQRAVRAPNIVELFQGSANGFPSFQDPCAGGVTGALRDFCVQTGIPASRIDTFEEADSQVEATFGGNPDLSEEESDTITFGFVYQPEWLSGLSLTLDYYQIEIDGAIDVAGGGVNNLIALCYQSLNASSEFCQAITRDANGDIINVNALNANIAEFTTEGIDLQVQYAWDLGFGLGGDGSTLTLQAIGNHTMENSFVPAPGQPQRDCEGRFGSPCGQTLVGTAIPENKWDTSLTWASGPMSVFLQWSWIDEVTDTRIDDGTPANTLPVPELDSISYWNLSGRYSFNDMIDLTLGVENLFDEDPPKYGDQSVQSNTDPSTYDVLGRRYWAGLTVRF